MKPRGLVAKARSAANTAGVNVDMAGSTRSLRATFRTTRLPASRMLRPRSAGKIEAGGSEFAPRRPQSALGVQAAAQLAEWHHDVLAIGVALAQAPIPGFHVRDRGPLDLQFEIAIERRAGWDVGQRERVTAQEPPVREHPVQQFEMTGAAGDLVADGGPVSLRFRRPIEAPEDAHEKVRLQRRLRPVHPAVDLRARAGIVRPEAAMARSEITQDRMRFPHDGAVIVD